MKVLVVDDNPDDLFLANACLENDYECITTSDIGDAIRIYADTDLELVISDMEMPPYIDRAKNVFINNGIDLLKTLRNLYPEKTTPIYIMSGTESFREESLEAGAEGFINKKVLITGKLF